MMQHFHILIYIWIYLGTQIKIVEGNTVSTFISKFICLSWKMDGHGNCSCFCYVTLMLFYVKERH